MFRRNDIDHTLIGNINYISTMHIKYFNSNYREEWKMLKQ